jgi:2,3-dihydro-2,3-dihydroxybenzoate dehydrogenase
MNTPEFANRIALVTGAAGGIGAAVTSALTASGAVVAAVDRDAERLVLLDKVAAETGARVHTYTADVADSAEVDGTVDEVEHTVGPIDYLVNVAGVLYPADVLSTTDDEWRDTFAVNTTGVFHTCRAVAGRMATRRSGAIVTVASNVASVPRTRMAAYAASKAAIATFTRCLGLELAPHGIRCNVVSPGSTDTNMFRTLHAHGDPVRSAVDGDPGTYRVGVPLGKIALPTDVAEAIVFLLSGRAGHITLQSLYVDGGAALGG